MSDTKNATETLVAEARTVRLGAEDIVIRTFCLAKTIRAFALLSELAEQAGISNLLGAANDSALAGEFEGAIAPGFISRLVAFLPKALRDGTPAVYKLVGLLVTSNRDLREMDEAEKDVDTELLRIGKRLSYEANPSQFAELITASVELMGVRTVLGNLRGLIALARQG